LKILFLLLIFLSPLALGSLPSVTGRAFSDVYVPTANRFPDQPFEQLSTSLWLETAPQINESFNSKFIYQGDGFEGQDSSVAGDSQSTHLQSTLREGYISYVSPGWDFRFGKQIISWGKSDVINPTDFHSAKNYTFFNPDDEVRRIGSLSLQGVHTFNEGNSPVSLTLIWTPLFAQGKTLFPPSLVPANIYVGSPVSPPVEMGNSEVSGKLSYSGQGWDTSISGFSGYSHSPELQVTSISGNPLSPSVVVSQVYRNVWSVGADGSYSSERWIYRGETAFTQTPNNDGQNPTQEPSHWDSVLGAERALGGHFRGQGQFIYRYFPQYTSPNQATGPDPLTTQVNQVLASENAILLQYQDQVRPSVTLRLSYTDDKNGWDGEIFYLENLAGDDFVIRPRVSYAWTDLFKTTLGLELYGGPTNRPLGAYAPYSAIFFEAKYTF
jgi:hypothetical protein